MIWHFFIVRKSYAYSAKVSIRRKVYYYRYLISPDEANLLQAEFIVDGKNRLAQAYVSEKGMYTCAVKYWLLLQ